MESKDADIIQKLSLLVRLAVADRHFAGLEKDVIFRIGKAHGLDEQAIARIIRFPLPMNNPHLDGVNEKIGFLKECLELVKADRKVLESEVIFFKSIAIRLGFKRDIVDQLLENRPNN
ncbi:MAG: hypothetical protein ACKO3B_09030 [Bacteroidota bacterium]